MRVGAATHGLQRSFRLRSTFEKISEYKKLNRVKLLRVECQDRLAAKGFIVLVNYISNSSGRFRQRRIAAEKKETCRKQANNIVVTMS